MSEQPGSLAERLYRMREAAGLTQPQLAERMGWGAKSGPPRISRIERERELPSTNVIRKWAEATGNSDDIPALLGMLADLQTAHIRRRKLLEEGGEAALQDEFAERFRTATCIRNFEVATIPGMLQTPVYARAIFTQVSAVYPENFPLDKVDEAVRNRMRRQDALYDQARQFEFLTSEAALRLRPCPVQAMLGQLDRLLNLELLDNVTLGIIPFSTELSMSLMNGFLLLDDWLVIETYSGEDNSRGEESEDHSRVFGMLMSQALTGDDARRLIMAVAEELRESTLSEGRENVPSDPEPAEHEPG